MHNAKLWAIKPTRSALKWSNKSGLLAKHFSKRQILVEWATLFCPPDKCTVLNGGH